MLARNMFIYLTTTSIIDTCFLNAQEVMSYARPFSAEINQCVSSISPTNDDFLAPDR
jgi:phosphosulfolactate phosphohydrolase-like enzyme